MSHTQHSFAGPRKMLLTRALQHDRQRALLLAFKGSVHLQGRARRSWRGHLQPVHPRQDARWLSSCARAPMYCPSGQGKLSGSCACCFSKLRRPSLPSSSLMRLMALLRSAIPPPPPPPTPPPPQRGAPRKAVPSRGAPCRAASTCTLLCPPAIRVT